MQRKPGVVQFKSRRRGGGRPRPPQGAYRHGRRVGDRTLLAGAWPWLLLVIMVGALAIGRYDAPGPEAHLGGTPLDGVPSRIIDGDTFDLAGERIRLHGIDAPEMDTDAGPPAQQALVQLVGERTVRCSDTGERSYGRVVAICRDGAGEDIAAAMVSAGWALDAPRFSNGRYRLRQWRAQMAGHGMYGR